MSAVFKLGFVPYVELAQILICTVGIHRTPSLAIQQQHTAESNNNNSSLGQSSHVPSWAQELVLIAGCV